MANLAETVVVAHQTLQSRDYSNTVRRLFALTNETDVAAAALHLQKPKCLAMYEQLFAQLVTNSPTVHSPSKDIVTYSCHAPIVVGTNSWDRFDSLEVMFVFNGSNWIFHDPSFERKLGRKMTSKEQDVEPGGRGYGSPEAGSPSPHR
jgi:hypothetical protein